MKIIVTTPQAVNNIEAELEQFLNETGFQFVPRERRSLKSLLNRCEADAVIVWKQDGPVLHSTTEEFFFHPSMAKVRISAFRKKGTPDPLVQAADLKNNDTFLDCTLGLGADAIAASYFAPAGRIVGLEASPIIAAVVKWGMIKYKSGMQWLDQAVKRVEVINADHYDYLRELGDQTFDIVYFDPMFRRPLMKSQPISVIRKMADTRALDTKTVQEACRVAKRRVIIKERHGSEEFMRLGCTRICGSPNNNTALGIIDIR